MKKITRFLLAFLLIWAQAALAIPPAPSSIYMDDGTTTGPANRIRWPNGAITSLSNGVVSLDLTGATGAPLDAPYLTTTAVSGLSAEANLGALTTGILKITVSGGVATPATASAGDFPTLNQNTTGTAAGLSAQYIDWNAASGGASIANKPTLGTMAAETATNYVAKSLYDAHTVLYATNDNTPAVLTVTEQTVIGRATGGNISALAIDSDLSSVSANDDTVPSAKATKAYADSMVPKTLYDAYSVLYADTDNTPAAVTLSASNILGRGSTGGIAALSIGSGLAISGTTLSVDIHGTTAETTIASDDEILIYDTSAGAIRRMTRGNFVYGLGGGGGVILDLNDDGSNESTSIAEIAVVNDNAGADAIFSEPSSDKLKIDVGKVWPTAAVANSGDSATAFFSTGTLELARGGTGLGTVAAGSILAANSADTLSAVSSTSGLKLLQNSDGTISWSSAVTGTGAPVLANTPTLITPNLGVATATSINKLALTAPATSATLTLANGSSLITSGAYAITLTSTNTTNVTLPTSGTLYGTASGSITSANLYGSLSDETGSSSGSPVAVFSVNPTLSGVTFADGTNIAVNTITGTKIGTATNQKLAFYNSTPITQPSGSILTALSNLGLVSSPTIAITELSTFTSANLYGRLTDETGSGSGSPLAVFNQNPTIAGITLTGAVNAGGASSVTLSTGLTGVLRADSGVVSVDTDVTDIVSAASTTAAGKIEIATNAETVAGTSTTLAVTPDDLAYLFASPFAIGGTTPAAATFTTISAGATGFSVDASGNVGAKSITIAKSTGIAGDLALYEANSLDVDAAGFKGPASLSSNTSYRGQFPNTRPNSANMVLAWDGSTATGSGTPSDPYVHSMSFVDLDNYLLLSGGTMSAGSTLITAASASGQAGLRLPHGTAPSSPVNGDIWTTTAGVYARINGGTVGPFGSSAADVSGGSSSGTGELAAYGDTTGKLIGRSYVAFSGPGTSVKTKTISNANDTIAELGQTNTFTALNTFSAGGIVGNGATGPGYWDFLEDSDNGTNYGRIIGQSSLASNLTYTLPAESGTFMLTTGSPASMVIASQATGDLLYASSASSWARLGIQAAGYVLAGGSTPTWSNAPQITTIELGNASDTTLSRSAAGELSVEGVKVLTETSTNTITNKTFDANGTGNTLKGYSYIQIPGHSYKMYGSSVTAPSTTATAFLYNIPKFSNSADKANNYIDFVFAVPDDIDTAVDLTAKLSFILGGADTGDHEYIVSMCNPAGSAAAACTPGDAISLAYSPDASGADGDIEYTTETTLTGWRSAMTAGRMLRVRLERDGDHANDTSTVDSYPAVLTLKYGYTN